MTKFLTALFLILTIIVVPASFADDDMISDDSDTEEMTVDTKALTSSPS
jgi:preprotein translocase subunit SecG